MSGVFAQFEKIVVGTDTEASVKSGITLQGNRVGLMTDGWRVRDEICGCGCHRVQNDGRRERSNLLVVACLNVVNISTTRVLT